MAMTLRLPEELAERARRYAAELGISLNGLLAIALREYLDARKAGRVSPPPRALAQAIARASESRTRAATQMKPLGVAVRHLANPFFCLNQPSHRSAPNSSSLRERSAS